VLSYFFLGKEINGHPSYRFTLHDLVLAFGDLKTRYEGEWLEKRAPSGLDQSHVRRGSYERMTKDVRNTNDETI